MKLAYFTDTYLPNKDGVVVSILNFKNELEKRGNDVYIFCPEIPGGVYDNESVFAYSSTTFKPYPEYKVALFPYLADAKLKELGVDIIHSHALASMGVAARRAVKKTGLPSVATFHTLVPMALHYLQKGKKKNGIDTAALELVLRVVATWATKRYVSDVNAETLWDAFKWFFKPFDAVVCPSKYTQEIMSDHGIDSEVVPTGIDISRFNTSIDSSGFRKKFGLEKREVILHVGRLVVEKNFGHLIEAAPKIVKEIPNALFLVVGSGPAKPYFMRKIARKKLQKHFHFTGFLPDELLPEAYSSCSVLAFPSTFETQGLVALEAMACGKPVVCAANSAVSDVVHDGGNGRIFENEEDFGEKIIECIRKNKKYEKNARKTALKYSNKKCTTKLVKLYESII